jgi:hypothetical protein
MSFDKEKHEDIYINLEEQYTGLGIYWSYDEDTAEAHSSGAGDQYRITAWIKPEYIDWVMTIYKSAYDLKIEDEIQVNEGVDILVTSIEKTLHGNLISEPIEINYILKT